MYLLDTSALLSHFRGEAGAEQVQRLFDDDEAQILIASPSLPEMARRLRDLGFPEAEIDRVVGQYQEAVCEVVPIDAEIAWQSYDLIRRVPDRLPLVDALIASAARSRQARLTHRDRHFRGLPESVVTQLDLERPAGEGSPKPGLT